MMRCNNEGCTVQPIWVAKYLTNGVRVKVLLCENHLMAIKGTVQDLKTYPVTPEVKKIDRSYEQVGCLTCGTPILLPELRFFSDQDEMKKRSIFCVMCRSYYVVRVKKSGPIEIWPHNEIKKYDQVPSTLGCHASTPVYYRRDAITDLIETRCGIVVMGSMNFPNVMGACPFDANFRDNYIQGFAPTLEESLKILLEEASRISKGLFA